MRLISCLMVIIISLLIFACGGGNGGEAPVVLFVPEKIPSQYKGLSMGELAAQSSDISHEDMIGTISEGEYTGTTSEGAFTAEAIEDITANILEHKGTLLHDIGVIETVYPSSEEGVFTLWFCSLGKGDQTLSGNVENSGSFTGSADTSSDDCDDPLFLLYDLDRGPELKTGDIIEVIGVIVGSQKKAGPRIMGQDNSSISGTTRLGHKVFLKPSISVIKAITVND